MKLGAHISTAKPFSDSIIRAQELDCDCMQIFVNPPQRWSPSVIPAEEVAKYLELNKDVKISPVIIHSIYLVNLASENTFYYEQSIASLIDDMQKATKLGAIGVNTHLGSTKGLPFGQVLPKIVSAINDILAATDEKALFIIENAAGAGNIIGASINEISKIINAINSPRVRVLIDTAHAFESGYNLTNAEGIEDFLTKFDQSIGLDKLIGFHLNDSKTPLNSKRDRHADIGFGHLGAEPFEYLIKHEKLKDKFGILETPQDDISWQDQLAQLRSYEEV
ncbi:MAG: deoxyribonuclease IV [bacterium]